MHFSILVSGFLQLYQGFLWELLPHLRIKGTIVGKCNGKRKVPFPSIKSCAFFNFSSPVVSRVPVGTSTPSSNQRHHCRRVVMAGDDYNDGFGDDDET